MVSLKAMISRWFGNPNLQLVFGGFGYFLLIIVIITRNITSNDYHKSFIIDKNHQLSVQVWLSGV